MIVQLDEQLLVTDHLVLPGFRVDVLQLVEGLLREFEALPIDVLIAGNPADRLFPCRATGRARGR